jgi:hypothetical protein
MRTFKRSGGASASRRIYLLAALAFLNLHHVSEFLYFKY